MKKIKQIIETYKILGVSVCILILLGALPSVITSNWTWFSRSGSLLIIWSVYIIYLELREEMDYQVLQDQKNYKKITGSSYPQHFGSVRVSIHKFFKNVEFINIAVGTLVWGYGDLLNVMYS